MPNHAVIQVASTNEDAIAALQSYLSGQKNEMPHMVVMGGGFTPADYEQVASVDGAKSFPWFRPDPKTMAGVARGEQPPTAEQVAQRLKSAISEHIEEIRQGKGESEVRYF